MGPLRHKSLLLGGTDTQRGKGSSTLSYGQGSGMKRGSDAGNRLCPQGLPFYRGDGCQVAPMVESGLEQEGLL